MFVVDSISLPVAATDWATALSGIVGVLIGGAITTGGTVWAQRRVDKREKLVEARQLGAALSLVHSNLQEILASLQVLERDGAWRAPLSEHWLIVWQDRADAIAAAVERDDFETLAEAFLVARLFVWYASRGERPFSKEDLQTVVKWQNKVREARATLDKSQAALSAAARRR